MRATRVIGVALVSFAPLMAAVAQTPPARPGTPRVLTFSGSHGYFESLVSLPQHFRSWSLRDQAQLDGLTNLGESTYFTYRPTSDSYPTPQDGAKFFKPVDDRIGFDSDSIPGNQQLKMPIGIGTGSVLITHDFWYGCEFISNKGSLGNYKTFQVRMGSDPGDANRYWTHDNQFRWAIEPNDVSQVSESLTGQEPWPAGVEKREPFTPPGVGAVGARSFPIKCATWTRYWYHLELHVPSADSRWDGWKSMSPTAAGLSGTYHMLSLWIADENRPPTRILYRVPWRALPYATSFDYEFNTSAHPPTQTGPLIGYGRNVVMLHDYSFPVVPETDVRIFVQPRR